MPFVCKKFLNHGTSNPIVARLSLQTLTILDQCAVSKETRDKVGNLYVNSLQRKLLRCWEIKERFRQEFNAAAEAYKLPTAQGQAVEIPQIGRLEEECHNFLYEAKNYVRDALKVFNALYGTHFQEASEFYRAKKGEESLIEYGTEAFGSQNPKTMFLKEAAGSIEYFIGLRNAVEHPGGYNGELRIENFSLDPDGKISEPTWFTVKDDRPHGLRGARRLPRCRL
jgi:hypothetical protein